MKGHMLKSKEFRATGKFALKFALRVSRLSVCKKVRSYLVLCLIARESGLIFLTNHKPAEQNCEINWSKLKQSPKKQFCPDRCRYGDRWGATDIATLSLHLILFSASLRALQNFNPVHSEILLSQRFFCRPLLLPPFTVPCKIADTPFVFQTWSHSWSNKSFLRQNSSTLATYG